jgi:hypothetical protein
MAMTTTKKPNEQWSNYWRVTFPLLLIVSLATMLLYLVPRLAIEYQPATNFIQYRNLQLAPITLGEPVRVVSTRTIGVDTQAFYSDTFVCEDEEGEVVVSQSFLSQRDVRKGSSSVAWLLGDGKFIFNETRAKRCVVRSSACLEVALGIRKCANPTSNWSEVRAASAE